MKPPDVHRIINKGLGDMKEVLEQLPESARVPIKNRIKLTKIKLNSLASLGFQEFRKDSENNAEL